MPRSSIPEADLFEELRRLAEDLGRVPTHGDMADDGRFSPATYENRFGSWLNALVEAGFDVRGREATPASREAILLDVRLLADQLGRAPTTRDYAREGSYSLPTAYKYTEGSWEDVLDAAGVDGDPASRDRIPEEDLLDELRAATAALGRPPTPREMNEYGAYSATTYYNRFGDWEAALAAAGVD